jgi:hypothetical protein
LYSVVSLGYRRQRTVALPPIEKCLELVWMWDNHQEEIAVFADAVIDPDHLVVPQLTASASEVEGHRHARLDRRLDLLHGDAQIPISEKRAVLLSSVQRKSAESLLVRDSIPSELEVVLHPQTSHSGPQDARL